MRLLLLRSATILSLTAALGAGCGDDGPAATGGGGASSSSSPSQSSGVVQSSSSPTSTSSSGGQVSSGSSSSGAGSSSSPGACSISNAFWKQSGQYASVALNPYIFRNNEWNAKAAGAGTQNLWYASKSCWGVDATHTDAAPAGTVKGFPDMARGWTVGAAGIPAASKMGIQVSAITKAKIRWKMSAPTTGRTWALWDIYLHESLNPTAGNAPVNLLIQQRIVDDSGWMQSDSGTWPKQTFSGYTFRESTAKALASGTRNVIRLYGDPASGSVIGYDDMTLDLKAVLDHYVQQGSIKSTDYLTSIQAGWEIVSGGSYVTTDFWTALQDEADGG